jgi:YidC/Oxa1 family membrane protein insertase
MASSRGRTLVAHLDTLAASALLSFSLLLFNPLLVYFSDPARLGDLPLRFLVQQLSLAAALALGLSLACIRFGRRCSLAVAFACLIVVVYSYLVQIDFGVFRGDRFSNEASIFETARLAYWIEPIALLLAFFVVRAVLDRRRHFFAVFYGLLFCSLAYDVLGELRDYRSESDGRARVGIVQPRETLLRLSSSRRNILLFVPDAGSGDLLAELMREPGRALRFDGFVHHRNTVSVGSFTLPSAAALIGGEHYHPDRINERRDKTILANLQEAYGWLAGVLQASDYETTFLNPIFVECEDLEQVGTCLQVSDFKKGLEERFDLGSVEVFDAPTVLYFAAFKALPFSLKPVLYRSRGWRRALISANQLAAAVNKRFHEFLFLEALPSISTASAEAPSQFIHLWNSQLIAPFSLDPQCNPLIAGRERMYSGEARRDATRCVIDTLATWFDWMRDRGVYDNTLIIIAADHGAADYGDEWYKGAVKPMLLVKDFDRSEPFGTSEILLQNSDVAAIICSALGGCDGIPQSPIEHPIADRTARYFYTTHGNVGTARTRRRFEIKSVYEIRGNVYDDPEFQ